MKSIVSIIIVTHNSKAVIARCLRHLDRQSVMPDQVVVIDSGSDDPSYLNEITKREKYVVKRFSNIGFGKANNKGLECVDPGSDYVCFINPDTFLFESALEKCLELIAKQDDVAMVTGLLEGYNLRKSIPTGRIDSTGIFRSWYGRWYDRGQGDSVPGRYDKPEDVPAVCGAFMFCRAEAIKPELPEFFDSSFFMYKEDIELSIRLTKMGWKLFYSPEIKAYHCRGWIRDRASVSRENRLMSAYNEVSLYRKHPSLYMIWALGKYVLVKYCNV